MENIKLFYIQCFFLFVSGDDIKTNDLELHFCNFFRYNISAYVKICTSSAVIYLLERVY